MVFHLNSFIENHVIKRSHSLFDYDINQYADRLHSVIEGSSVLVIGGAGSIGSNFIKTILPFHPKSLVVVDTNENALTELTRDLRSSRVYIPYNYIPYPMDYSSITFYRMFKHNHGFDIVANFSAHKHVRSEKDIYSVEALLRNNLINAQSLLELLCEYEPKLYFCVSTDKAANPVNIMGASKRLMEDLIFAYSDVFPVKTARFANVAFSNGSLPAGFLERLGKLQPLSAPSDVKRYFVSPEESGQICMMASILGTNREIFFPKLEEESMMTFDEIAVQLLKAKGYEILYCESEEEALNAAKDLQTGSRWYPVFFTQSDTSGEKGFEEFFTDDEVIDRERFASLGVITSKVKTDRDAITSLINELSHAFENNNTSKDLIVDIIHTYLPNFSHIETGRSLDGKM